MQKIKIKSTILVAILIAIFSTIMCMGFVSAEEIGTNVDTIVGTIAHRINYYDKSGALIKTESLLTGNNMTGIEGYEGNYVVRTENYDELYNILTFVVPTEDYVKENYVHYDAFNQWFMLNNDYDYTVEQTPTSMSDMIDYNFAHTGMVYDNGNFQYAFQINCKNILNVPDDAKMYSYISVDNTKSICYDPINNYGGLEIGISLCDNTNMPAPLKYSPNVGRTIEFTSIFDATANFANGPSSYVYYYLNETMSMDELTALNMDNVKSDTINVYTDIEPAQEPEEPTDEPTDEPSGDDNGEIILPPSDKPSDTNKPADETPIKEQSKLEKSNAELKAQWTALLAHDWQNANGWQLITLMTITLAVVIAIIVAIPVVCHQVKKATNVKRIKARSLARKR